MPTLTYTHTFSEDICVFKCSDDDDDEDGCGVRYLI